MMIQMIYEINNTYMVIDGTEIETAEDFRRKMLERNSIKNVLLPETRVINGEKRLFVDISGKESLLNRFGSRMADRQEVKALFEGIFCVTEKLSKYLISECDIAFRPEMIFRNPLTKEYEFSAVLLKDKEDGREEMKELLQFLMMRLDNSDDKLVNAIYGIHSMYSEDNPRFSVAFEYFLKEIKEESEQETEEPEESEIFANNISLQKILYIPGFKEIAALALCAVGTVLLGINLYWFMLSA